MSGTNAGKDPKDDAEWARQTQRRLESLENPASQRIGEWTLTTDQSSGALVASHVNGGRRIIATRPVGGENSPDAVIEDEVTELPYISVSKNAASTAGTQTFDTIDTIVGDWGIGGISPFSSFIIPETGLYRIDSQVRFNTPTTQRTSEIRVDNVAVAVGGFHFGSAADATWVPAISYAMRPLTVGQVVTLYNSTGPGNAVPAPRMTIVCLRRTD
jgi:hypothetical protein